jgi:hypothetical protein
MPHAAAQQWVSAGACQHHEAENDEVAIDERRDRAGGMLARKNAPSTPPSTPGSASWSSSLRSTLPNQACAAPDAAVVAISAVCTLALATTGGNPSDSSTDEDTSP